MLHSLQCELILLHLEHENCLSRSPSERAKFVEKNSTKPSLAPHGGTVFVIGPIGERGSGTRKRSDDILKFLIRPAARACKLGKVLRADELAEPGSITNQVIQRLIEDDLV